MRLTRSFATREYDEDAFAAFSSWAGRDGEPWIEEADNYVRVSVLRHAAHVLAFRDAARDLVAVSAFDERTIAVPLAAPVDHPGWHLQVVAIRVEDQRKGLSQLIFQETFAAMRELDPERVLVTAHAHKDHFASISACRQAGIEAFYMKDDDYWMLLGEVPEQTA